uniref:Antirestriction protein n=1 Tax=Panagrellus redivivus TaxID=6233 RepID=A0A7E4WBM5_PANRE
MRKSSLRTDLFSFHGKVMKKVTLRPHLFDEMIDTMIARAEKRQQDNENYCWTLFLPEDICGFAVSSVAAYKIVVYLLKNLLTKIVDYDGDVLFKSRSGVHPLTFYMDENCHIEALMRVAGQYCTSTFRNFDQLNNVVIDWRSAVYDGLFENKAIESPDALIFRVFRNKP